MMPWGVEVRRPSRLIASREQLRAPYCRSIARSPIPVRVAAISPTLLGARGLPLEPASRLTPSEEMGLLLQVGEGCQLESATDAVILTVEVDQLAADPCGISHPERVMGQQWASFESN
jgi:hypothetical protein